MKADLAPASESRTCVSGDGWQTLDRFTEACASLHDACGRVRETMAKMDALADAKRIDFLEQWLRNSEGRGFKWDTFTFNTGRTVREQLDELRSHMTARAQLAAENAGAPRQAARPNEPSGTGA